MAPPTEVEAVNIGKPVIIALILGTLTICRVSTHLHRNTCIPILTQSDCLYRSDVQNSTHSRPLVFSLYTSLAETSSRRGTANPLH